MMFYKLLHCGHKCFMSGGENCTMPPDTQGDESAIYFVNKGVHKGATVVGVPRKIVKIRSEGWKD